MVRTPPAPDPAASELSPPVDSCATLQVPIAASTPARGSDTLHALPPRAAAHSPSLSRLLRRQVGISPQVLQLRLGAPQGGGVPLPTEV